MEPVLGGPKLQQTGKSSPLLTSKHKHFPAGVGERAAEEEGVHRLVHQPVKHHLPVPWSNGHPQLEVAPLTQVIVADGEQVHHFHVKGYSRAHGDGGQLVGHLFTVYKHSTCEEKHRFQLLHQFIVGNEIFIALHQFIVSLCDVT